MLKVLINGINGQMGTEVAKLVLNCKQMHLLGGLDKHIVHNLPYPVYDTVDNILEKPNVIIDFSVASATVNLLPFCLKNTIPIVIATTGFTLEEQKQINNASLKIPIFQSANMSYGITLISKIIANLSKELNDSEIEIVETHHRLKKDAPSGTALLLADCINKANNNIYSYEINRTHKKQKRSPKEIGFSSIRGGNIVGTHQVIFFGENENIEIKHTAYCRTIFAEGAIKAANFLVKQNSGLFSMNDLV